MPNTLSRLLLACCADSVQQLLPCARGTLDLFLALSAGQVERALERQNLHVAAWSASAPPRNGSARTRTFPQTCALTLNQK